MKQIKYISDLIFFVKRILWDVKHIISGREKRIHYGKENPDKIFYLIGQDDEVGGLWWLIHKTLMHIGYAIDKGYIPIVDLQNYKTQYLEKNALHRENVWEYYFKQPAGWSLSDIKHSENIIISKKAPTPSKKYFMGHFYNDNKRIEYFRELFKKYIICNQSTNDYLLSEYEHILKDKGKILGVLCRGTDYVLNKPAKHPIQPDTTDVITKAQEVMGKYNCSFIYLSTEDENIYNSFKSYFKEKLLVNNQQRISREEMKNMRFLSEAKAKININSNKGKYLSGLGYLSSINLLSKCSCFIGGRTGGTKGVLLMTDGFEYEYIFDLGYYK